MVFEHSFTTYSPIHFSYLHLWWRYHAIQYFTFNINRTIASHTKPFISLFISFTSLILPYRLFISIVLNAGCLLTDISAKVCIHTYVPWQHHSLYTADVSVGVLQSVRLITDRVKSATRFRFNLAFLRM